MQILLFLILFSINSSTSNSFNADITKRKIRSHGEEDYENYSEPETYSSETETEPPTSFPPSFPPSSAPSSAPSESPPTEASDSNTDGWSIETVSPENVEFVMDNTPPWMAPTTTTTTTPTSTPTTTTTISISDNTPPPISTTTTTASETNLNAGVGASNANAGASGINANTPENNAGSMEESSISASGSEASQRELTLILKKLYVKVHYHRAVSLETFCQTCTVLTHFCFKLLMQ